MHIKTPNFYKQNWLNVLPGLTAVLHLISNKYLLFEVGASGGKTIKIARYVIMKLSENYQYKAAYA